MGTKIEGGVIDGLTITTPERRKCRAKRYAIKFNPPCLFLEYEDALRKRRVRAVKINSLSDSVKVDDLTRKVIKSFPRILDPDSVKYDQVKNLIQQLINNYKALKATEKAADPKSNADTAPASVDVDSTLELKHPTSASAESQEKAKSKAKDLELKLFMNDASTLAHSSGDTNISERESAPSKASPSSTRSSPSTFSSGGQDDLDECGVDHDRSESEVARSSCKDLIDDSSPPSRATIPSTLALGSTPAALPGKGDGQSLAAAAASTAATPLPRRLGGLPSLAPIGVSSPVGDRLKALPPLHSPSSTLLGGGGALAPLKGPLGLGKERPTSSLLDVEGPDEAEGGKEEEEEEKEEEEEEEEEEHNAKDNDASKQEDGYHHGDDESTEEEEEMAAKEIKGIHMVD
uniref:Centrosomal protein of 19 kDa n=1 Tax=Polytomella parva TaxID=51329 RepID=A0A7S0YKN6_9CHLO|mmetsp:Transcript_26313/g.48230  ORF Transcript_26313/g.48230 Transcript_26313/m.48230 type:complete len:404 (+) Transcript_26313:104-1315(+)